MKKITLPFLALSMLMSSYTLHAQTLPKPAHVIIVMEENYAYSQIIGSSYAPVLTALSKEPYTASFTQDYALTHPSEPNYLMLFSGSDQGVKSDLSGPAPNAPFNNCNLGASVIAKGYTFIGYSEDQPSNCSPSSCTGWIAGDNNNYYTKHCPWINWVGGSTDVIPANSDVPYNYNASVDYTSGPIFPDSNNYSSLPTVCWVIPNSVDDMHDGSSTTAIPNGDNWFHTNMMPLVRWASNPANKSVVITTWDEDDSHHSNNVPLLISGGMVNGGNVTTKVSHYDLLKTVEDMYGLTECGASSTATGLPKSIWVTTEVNSITGITNEVTAYPVPAKNVLNVKVTSTDEGSANIKIYDLAGRKLKELPTQLKSGENYINLSTADISNGVYLLTIIGDKINVCKKIAVEK